MATHQFDPIPFKRTDPRAITPTREHQFDAGMDLYGLEDVVVRPGEVVRVHTGIHIALNVNEVCLFWGKSGRSWNVKENRPVGLTVLGGCIDGPYRGELSVVLGNANLSSTFALLNATIKAAMDTANPFSGNNIGLNDFQRAVAKDVIQIPYGKACVQFLIINGIRFPTLSEFSPEEWDKRFSDTERGEKGFSSSDRDRSPETVEALIISGPYEGQRITTVLRDYIYYKGVQHRRVRETTQYEPTPKDVIDQHLSRVAHGAEPRAYETMLERSDVVPTLRENTENFLRQSQQGYEKIRDEELRSQGKIPPKELAAMEKTLLESEPERLTDYYEERDKDIMHRAKEWCIERGIDPNGSLPAETMRQLRQYMYERSIRIIADRVKDQDTTEFIPGESSTPDS